MKISFSPYLLLLSLYLFALPFPAVCFQQQGGSGPAARVNKEGDPSLFSIGAHGGTTGFGVHISSAFSDKFGARLGASFMPFSTSVQGYYSRRDTRSQLNAHARNVSLMLSYTPFTEHPGFFRSFHLQLGGAHFFRLDGTIETQLAGPYRYGDLLISPEDLGEITTHVKWEQVLAPYLGAGLNDIVLDKHISLQADIGCYYLSAPQVSMEATAFLAENVNNSERIADNMKNYRYLPRIELGISYRIL